MTFRKVGVFGSKEWSLANPVPFDDLMKELIEKHGYDLIIVSGGAPGADRMAESAAKRAGIITARFNPAWIRNGVSRGYAGFERNSVMVDYADDVYLFWDGISGGTKDSGKKAREQHKLRRISFPNGRVMNFKA